MTEPGHAMENPNREAPNQYALTPQGALMLGMLHGLLLDALGTRSLSVSPVTDHHGNYLSLLRFTYDDEKSPTTSWVLQLVMER